VRLDVVLHVTWCTCTRSSDPEIEQPVHMLTCERAVHTRVEMVVTMVAAVLCAVLPTVAGASTHAGTKPNV
jgi:hypothetical protein